MSTKALDSGGIKRQEVDDMTSCSICFKVYTDPKALPCIHTFCMKCLQEIGIKTSKGPGDEMPCPICQRLFKIPTDGFHGLPKHFLMERLIQLSNVSDQSASSRSLCDASAEEHKEETESQNIKQQNTTKETETKLEEFETKLTMGHKGNDNLKLKTILYRRLAEVVGPQTEFGGREETVHEQAQELQQQESSDPMTNYREKPKLIKKIDIGHSVWGLAMLNKELFVASIDDGAIFVYDPVAYKRLRTIRLDSSVRPRDIAACPQKNCLVVVTLASPWSLFCIDHKGKILKQWQVPYEPHNLSVMPSGNTLLMCNARILIYNSDGNIIQDLKLDANALDVSWHAILLRSGNYLVCQGWMGSKHHRVLSLSPEGAIIKSFGSERQTSNSHLSNPVYMTMDRDELIFVADSGNNRVVVLSQGLVFLKELLSKKDGVIEPYRVLLDEASRLLYVGTSDCQLLVFDVFK